MSDNGAGHVRKTLVHEADRERYEVLDDGNVVAVLCYGDETDAQGQPTGVRDLRSTVVGPDVAGQGLGSLLVRRALDDARAAGLQVRATCWFADGWIRRHEDYSDLLVPGSQPVVRPAAPTEESDERSEA